MNSDSQSKAIGPWDRTPFAAAQAVMKIVHLRCADLPTEADVWRDLLASRQPDERHYLEAIAQTRHSVFYYQMQQLYEWAIARTRSSGPEDFCREVGRSYSLADSVIEESLQPMLQAGLANPGEARATALGMIALHIQRQGDNKRYTVEHELSADHALLRIAYQQPEAMTSYLQQYGLDPARCFRNSFFTMLGAAENFISKIVTGYDPARLKYEIHGVAGVIRLPIGSSARFAFDSLAQTLMVYIRDVQKRKRSTELESFESSLVIASRTMRELWDRVGRASRTDEIVLLRGESGTGKSFLARKIHEMSRRRDKPLIEVALTSDVGSDNFVQSNLFGHEKGAFTGATETKQGLFSLADGGTIFLDEIGDASAELQAKLLRVIESSTFKRLGGVRDLRVDVRVIAATNRNLEEMVETGTFRRDLYYRINVIPLVVPPLRDRPDDVPALAQFLLARMQPEAHKRLSSELSEQLRGYAWPGNVRELEHALKHAVAMSEGDELEALDFPPVVRSSFGRTVAAETMPYQTKLACGTILNIDALRQAIRSAPALGRLTTGHTFDVPAHIDYVRRIWLATLIEELHGDLSLIGLFWDRSSEKTLRGLIREYELTDKLAAARGRE